MKNNVIIISFGVIILVIVLIVGVPFFFGTPLVSLFGMQPTTTEDSRLKVSASTALLGEFTMAVAGDHIQFVSVAPEGVGAHDIEPSAQDIAKLQDVDLFITHGVGLDAWADRIRSSLEDRGVTVVVVTQGMQLRNGADVPASGDPHVWLDPIRAQQMVSTIRDQLVVLDPTNANAYEDAARRYIEQLRALDSDFTVGLTQCQQRTIIVAHDSFGYLGDRYNLNVLSIVGISPESEPSARHLAEITDLARSNNVTTIFFETLASPTLAKTLAQEVGASTAVLNPLEGLTAQERAQGKTYLSVMQENLQQLRTALHCI